MGEIETLMRDCLKNMQEGNSIDAADFFADDGVWVTPFGRFKGKEEIKKFLNWQNKTMTWSVKKSGNDIIMSGNKAFFEHEINATIEGRPVNLPAMCAWEFDENNKVQEVRTVYDRFSTLEQAATGVGKLLVNQIGKKFIVE